MEFLDLLKFVSTTFGIFIILAIVSKIARISRYGKISVIDFTSIIAISSVLVSVLSSNKYSLYEGSLILAIVISAQLVFVLLIRKFKAFQRLFPSKGKIIMWNGKILEERLRKSNMTRSDLAEKLRDHNVFEFHEVKAVILENTGDISVIFNKEAVTEYQAVKADSNEATLSL